MASYPTNNSVRGPVNSGLEDVYHPPHAVLGLTFTIQAIASRSVLSTDSNYMALCSAWDIDFKRRKSTQEAKTS